MFLYQHEHILRFSNLHYCTFNVPIAQMYIFILFVNVPTQKSKYSIKNLFSKCDQIHRKLVFYLRVYFPCEYPEVSAKFSRKYWQFFSSFFFPLNLSCIMLKNNIFRGYRKRLVTWNGLICNAASQSHYTKMKFSIRLYSVNVTKSAGNSGYGHIYWGNT